MKQKEAGPGHEGLWIFCSRTVMKVFKEGNVMVASLSKERPVEDCVQEDKTGAEGL